MKWLKAHLGRIKNSFFKMLKAALIACVIILIAAIVWKVPEWQVRGYHGKLDAGAISKLTPQELIQLQKDLITAENNARVTIAQIIGGMVVLLGLYATFKNLKIAQDNHRVALENLRVTEEGKLTERFSKAVELLGSDKLDVRLGGIYALERIARDSQKDHWTVMEVLTAFIREQSISAFKSLLDNMNSKELTFPYTEQPKKRLREDIQAALSVIGRRKWIEQEKEHQRIDLRNSVLPGANLFKAPLRRAILSNTILMLADLREAELNSAIFTGARLAQADLSKARLTKAKLYRADLSEADLGKAKLDNANLSEANLLSAKLIGTDLTGANLGGANLTKANLMGADLTRAEFFTYTYFPENDVKRANISGARFWFSQGLTWEQISEVIIDETTNLPHELEEQRKAEQQKKAATAND